MKKISISIEGIKIEAKINNSKTAEKIWELIPIESKVSTWGNEIYFSIGEKIDLEENATEVVSMGGLAYWPPGEAICIFFGQTPASQGDDIRAASSVNIFGKIIGDAKVFKKVPSGSKIMIEK
jgi:uncharacterized protein